MNEKIIELAKEAGIHPANFEPDADLSGPLKKFAELIVRECMSIAQEYDGAKLGGPGLIIAMRIEQRFGVEE
jgi:hypothetical protein